ncbi:hypothetical protein Ssi03_36640 [Sphaerisporangium siamense]|uniref:Methionine-rich copper-binding protein CopC n=1 Tax=Sphaerisporangium siamense TaxID=795645 RepID=A0A7W7D761_9ACTN|nr:copper resistance protein CopC [Sphaerisporangium siamense]MBB4701548.1 methionine-rich copper-binding protein CopC [Sphaerisporangium siamense]GII85674.1 hypothetical protein Ssi03_36640 [Sphaerisporangium siamense]
MKTSFFRPLLVLCLSGVLLGLAAPSALAHDSLKSSSPAKNAVVSGLDKIELEFSARASFPAVVLTDASGKRYEAGPPHAEGPKVVQNVNGPLPSGDYVIAWRIVSSDGHPVEGEIPFKVNAPGGAPAPSAAQAAPVVSATPAAETSRGGFPVWILVVAVLVVIAVVVLFRLRGGSSSDPATPVATPEKE